METSGLFNFILKKIHKDKLRTGVCVIPETLSSDRAKDIT